MPEPQQKITGAQIAAITAEAFGLGLAEMLSESKARHSARPRQAAAHLMRKHTALTCRQIATVLRRSDHTTITYAVRHVDGLIATDPGFARQYRAAAERVEAEARP